MRAGPKRDAAMTSTFANNAAPASVPDAGGEWDARPLQDPPPPDEERLILDIGGFEGPLDLLLSLAREQKVDLSKISILALVEQYIAFIQNARQLRLEIAADYLVMAAWLAYLKSRLLLPEKPGDDEPTGEELAEVLAFRLRRLEAMRDAAEKLMARPRLGRDVFRHGAPAGIENAVSVSYTNTLYDLLSAYSRSRAHEENNAMALEQRSVLSLEDARAILFRLTGISTGWSTLATLLADIVSEGHEGRTALASSFAAALELAKQGHLELRQDEVFSPLYMRVSETQ